MPDRTINFGDDAADARYRIQDTSSTGGDFVVAEDLDGGTVLLEYDYSASEWVSRGPVNLDGNDITNAGSITADTLEADSAGVGGQDKINYWPPVRTQIDELDTTSPATSYSSLTLSGPPSDATHALIEIEAEGDGTSDDAEFEIREAGTTFRTINKAFWSENADFTLQEAPLQTPIDNNNTIEYRTSNISRAIIRTVGYF